MTRTRSGEILAALSRVFQPVCPRVACRLRWLPQSNSLVSPVQRQRRHERTGRRVLEGRRPRRQPAVVWQPGRTALLRNALSERCAQSVKCEGNKRLKPHRQRGVRIFSVPDGVRGGVGRRWRSSRQRDHIDAIVKFQLWSTTLSEQKRRVED